MFAEEWPLMMFTLLGQMAIGMYIILALLRTLLAQKSSPALAGQVTKKGFLAVGPIMAVALLLSLFHLGDPMGAYRSIGNLTSSWLSREILFAGLFFILWCVSYFSERKGEGSSILRFATVLVGLIAIYSMASIYTSSIRPAWANGNTYLSFFGTALAFGVVGAISALLPGLKTAGNSVQSLELVKKVCWIGIAAVLLPLVYLPVYITGLSGGVGAAQTSAHLLTGAYLTPLILRWILSALGMGLLVYTLANKIKSKSPLTANILYAALLLVFMGEFIGRYVFYATGISIMIG